MKFSPQITLDVKPAGKKIPKEYCAVQCTTDGNCLYNVISITLSGNEHSADSLRLSALRHAVVHYDHYIKMENFIHDCV